MRNPQQNEWWYHDPSLAWVRNHENFNPGALYPTCRQLNRSSYLLSRAVVPTCIILGEGGGGRSYEPGKTQGLLETCELFSPMNLKLTFRKSWVFTSFLGEILTASLLDGAFHFEEIVLHLSPLHVPMRFSNPIIYRQHVHTIYIFMQILSHRWPDLKLCLPSEFLL